MQYFLTLCLLATDPSQLIQELGDDHYAVRANAEENLKKLGKQAKPLLLEAVKDQNTERRLRATGLLDYIAREEIFDATPVTYKGTGTVADIIDQITDQVRPGEWTNPVYGYNTPNNKITATIAPTPYWMAVDEACKIAKVKPTFTGQYYFSELGKSPPTSYDGGFRACIVGVERRVQSDLDLTALQPGDFNSIITLRVEVQWEPKIPIMYHGQLRCTAATTDTGEKLQQSYPVNSWVPGPLRDNLTYFNKEIKLKAPSVQAKTIKDITLAFDAVAIARWATATIKTPTKPADALIDAGSFEVTKLIQIMDKVSVEMTYTSAIRDIQSTECIFGIVAKETIEYPAVISHDGTADYSIIVDGPIQEISCKYPAIRANKTLNFTFTDIPLPRIE